MLLPEFRTRVLMSAQEKKSSPLLDEETLGIIEDGIKAAVASREMIRIILYRSGGEEEKVGQITAIFPVVRELKLHTASSKIRIPFDEIIRIESIKEDIME